MLLSLLIFHEPRQGSTNVQIETEVTKRQRDEMRGDYIRQEGYQMVEMWNCEWWSLSESEASVKSHLRQSFPLDCILSEERHMQEIFDRKLL